MNEPVKKEARKNMRLYSYLLIFVHVCDDASFII